MKILRFILIGIAGMSTIAASVATATKMNVPVVTHPLGVKLRQDSVTGSRHGFVYFGGRSHYGGGIRSHK